MKLPPRAPNLNAYAERFVRTIKESCLDQMIFFGEDSLRAAIHEFVVHYHQERNHQGLRNRLIVRMETKAETTGPVERHDSEAPCVSDPMPPLDSRQREAMGRLPKGVRICKGVFLPADVPWRKGVSLSVQ